MIRVLKPPPPTTCSTAVWVQRNLQIFLTWIRNGAAEPLVYRIQINKKNPPEKVLAHLLVGQILKMGNNIKIKISNKYCVCPVSSDEWVSRSTPAARYSCLGNLVLSQSMKFKNAIKPTNNSSDRHSDFFGCCCGGGDDCSFRSSAHFRIHFFCSLPQQQAW